MQTNKTVVSLKLQTHLSSCQLSLQLCWSKQAALTPAIVPLLAVVACHQVQ